MPYAKFIRNAKSCFWICMHSIVVLYLYDWSAKVGVLELS